MNIFINDRSNLDQVVALIPAGHPENTTGKAIQKTLRESLQESYDKCWYPRSDVVLVNGTRSGKQYTVEVTPSGFSGDLVVLDFLSEEQHAKLEYIAKGMRENAQSFKPAKMLISGNYR